MNCLRLLLCSLLCMSAGCSYAGYAACNLVSAPLEAFDHTFERHRFRRMARAVWDQCKAENKQASYSNDYEQGFLDGYVDYLDYNGIGEPPAAPPWRYRFSHDATPEGRQAIVDWFAGFRHGAGGARASGYREVVVLPMALPPYRPLSVSEGSRAFSVPASPIEELPLPRILPIPNRDKIAPVGDKEQPPR